MKAPASVLPPVDDGTLGWMGWQRQVLAVEPVPRPVWQERPPDIEQVRASMARAQEGAAQQHQASTGTLAYLKSAYWWGVAALVFPVLTGVAVLVAGAALGASLPGTADLTTADQIDLDPVVTALIFLLLCSPWTAAVAWSARSMLAPPRRPGTLVRGLGLWLLAAVLAPFTAALSFVAVPVLVGLWVLLSRPKVFQTHSSVPIRAPQSLFGLYRFARAQLRESSSAIRSFDRRVRQEHDRAVQAYESRLAEFREREEQWSGFDLIPVPEHRDILVVGGAPAERGDLLHHVGAAVEQQDQGLWVLDLEGRSATSRLIGEARHRGRDVAHLHAADDTGMTALLDRLDRVGAGKRSLMVEVLASGLAYDAQGRVTSRAREVGDTLRRLSGVLRQHEGEVSLRRLHAALEALLGRTEDTSSSPVPDDFTLVPVDAKQAGERALSAGTTSAIRSSFTQQDRQHFHGAWTDIRMKIESLLPEEGPLAPEGAQWPPEGAQRASESSGWRPEADLAVSTVDLSLSPSERELRTALLASHYLELLRSAPQLRPTALAVLGAEALPVELLRQLSEVAGSVGTQLVLLFGELVPEMQSLARGRRTVAAFGGHGAAAAEELADLFGKEWQSRLQNYQHSWSDSEARSRTETSGRNWTRSDTSTEGSSYGSTSSGSLLGGYTTGDSWGRNRSDSSSVSQGDSSSLAEGSTSTEQKGGSQTHQYEYERRVTGAVISALPPFTMLVKHADSVAFADVLADLSLPEKVLHEALSTSSPPAGLAPGTDAGTPGDTSVGTSVGAVAGATAAVPAAGGYADPFQQDPRAPQAGGR